jgi:cytosine/uracil/thiamine/allantoin permease
MTTDPQQAAAPVPPWYQYARKAVITASSLAIVVASSLIISLTPDSDSGTTVSGTEWLWLVIAVATALGGTYATYKVPNDYGRHAVSEGRATLGP